MFGKVAKRKDDEGIIVFFWCCIFSVAIAAISQLLGGTVTFFQELPQLIQQATWHDYVCFVSALFLVLVACLQYQKKIQELYGDILELLLLLTMTLVWLLGK
jgi:uncharacterized membrane protein YbhN (UPF0104 family)